LEIVCFVVITGFLGFINITSVTAQGTEVGGTISTNTTWNLTGSPYHVIDNITVTNGATLTIEAGVEVKIDSHKWIIVEGSLQAIGNPSNYIYFDKYDTGNWFSIRFKNAKNDSILEYCWIEYGDIPIWIENCSPIIRNNWIYNNFWGIQINDYSSPIIYNNVLRYYVEGINVNSHSTPLIDNNIISNEFGPPYGWLSNFHGIRISNSNPKITNNTIAYNNQMGIICQGSGNPIIENNIISENDIYGINIEGSSVTIVNNTISNNEYCGIAGGSSQDVTITQNEIYNNKRRWAFYSAGIYLKRTSDNCTIEDNTLFDNYNGVYCEDSTPIITNNKIYNNERWGIHSLGAKPQINNNNYENATGSSNEYGRVLQEWRLAIQVTDNNGTNMNDIFLFIRDKSNNLVWNGYKSSFEEVIDITLKEYEIQNDGTYINCTPHEIFAIQYESGGNSTDFTMDSNSETTVELVDGFGRYTSYDFIFNLEDDSKVHYEIIETATSLDAIVNGMHIDLYGSSDRMGRNDSWVVLNEVEGYKSAINIQNLLYQMFNLEMDNIEETHQNINSSIYLTSSEEVQLIGDQKTVTTIYEGTITWEGLSETNSHDIIFNLNIPYASVNLSLNTTSNWEITEVVGLWNSEISDDKLKVHGNMDDTNEIRITVFKTSTGEDAKDDPLPTNLIIIISIILIVLVILAFLFNRFRKKDNKSNNNEN
jgi:parallel beta-helix repeat protein